MTEFVLISATITGLILAASDPDRSPGGFLADVFAGTIFAPVVWIIGINRILEREIL